MSSPGKFLKGRKKGEPHGSIRTMTPWTPDKPAFPNDIYNITRKKVYTQVVWSGLVSYLIFCSGSSF